MGALDIEAQSPSTALEIRTVAVVDGSITITGRNFGGSPTVTIDDQALGVSSSTDTEIVAGIPALSAGMHLLVVSRDGGATSEGTARSTVLVR